MRPFRSLLPIVAAIAVAAAALALGACGGEREFSAEEIVAELAGAGAPLVLGEVITTDERGVEVHSIEFADEVTSATGDDGELNSAREAHDHSTGTLLALESAEEARTEFERCETAPVLVCFRAANVVLRFEGLAGTDRARLVVALESLDNTG